jgi:hypothetical protein
MATMSETKSTSGTADGCVVDAGKIDTDGDPIDEKLVGKAQRHMNLSVTGALTPCLQTWR